VALFDDGLSGYGETSPAGQGSLRRYVDTIRERRWFVILAVVLCTLAATAYALTASKVYEATADMLVTPVPDDQTAVLGLGLLRKATDPTRDVTTAARLIDNAEVAARAKQDLRLPDSPEALLKQISVAPVANSSVVSITASTGSPSRSQRLANAFATAAVQERTDQLYKELDPALKDMRDRIKAIVGTGNAATANTAAQPLYQQLAAMEALRSAPDPTIRFETPATLPTGPTFPRTKLDIAGGVIAGLLIGIAGAFALNAFDPRKAREGGLGITGLPILTRVPLLTRGGRTRHAFDESFRSLRTTLRFAADDNPISTVAVTSASEQEGKTTTSFQLAMAMLEAGQSVLLVEADPFRPGLRSLVESDPADGSSLLGPGLLEYLSGTADLDDIIEPTNIPRLMFVPSGIRQPTSITGLLESERGRSFVGDMSALADVVILDCPPVGPRSDAVLIASYADAVVMVVDLQRSDEREVLDTVRRVRRTGAHLLGLVLNRDTSANASYEYRERDEKPGGRARALLSRR
jgi:capsular exopolysaccharide synthesis family protein